MGDLTGKVALVTGAGPNIGGAIAATLARAGAKVICNDLRPEQAEAAAQAIRSAGGQAVALAADISKPDDVTALMAKAQAAFGPIQILVNNAGVTIPRSILTMTFEEWRRVHSVILDGTFLMCQSVAKELVQRKLKGSIINIASTSGHRGRKNAIGYCAAKGGILNLTRAMAQDLAPHGIRVNSVSPTKTGVSVGALESSADRDFSEIPIGRLGDPQDQANAVLFLASENSSFITGEDIRVDGGTLATWGTRSQAQSLISAST